uniref:Uncharacterized protein n=1 Tax=Anguilla anguilla TaxID=7936 RepID=A0A0E9TM76_ANGAN
MGSVRRDRMSEKARFSISFRVKFKSPLLRLHSITETTAMLPETPITQHSPITALGATRSELTESRFWGRRR